MRRSWFVLALVCLTVIGVFSARPQPATAQTVPLRAQPGDPPIASLITLSPPDADGIVTISGAAGAVFPNSNVIIRNLYTEDTTFAPVGVTGGFTAQLYGEGNTPFWISPVAVDILNEDRDNPGSLPGGPGVILYGAFPAESANAAVTRLVLDGVFTDWDALPATAISPDVRALRSRDALWVSIADSTITAQATDGSSAIIRIIFTLNNTLFAVNVRPFAGAPATFERLNPNRAALESLLIASAITDGRIELRIPLGFIDRIDRAQITTIQILNADNASLVDYTLPESDVPFIDVPDGVYRTNGAIISDGVLFTLAGTLGNGASFWSARGIADNSRVSPGAAWRAALDVSLRVLGESLPADTALTIELRLQPIVQIDSLGRTSYPMDTHTNNGYTSALYAGVLPIDNLTHSITAARVQVPASALIRRANSVDFALDLAFEIDETFDLPRGLYTPVLIGSVSSGGISERWEFSALFGAGDGVSRVPLTRLPFVLNIDQADSARLPLALFYDDPSDGARGVLAAQDEGVFALSNRVKFNAPTYILPPFRDGTDEPITYSLEPFVMNVLSNAYDSTTAPLIPFAFDANARMTIRVTPPTGTRESYADLPILQGIASSAAVDERTRFGAQSPVDIYKLTTLDPRVTRYTFTEYGDYTIDVTVNLNDRDGNAYTGGGTYTVVVAEQFDLTPSVLPGTPFEVDDIFHAGAVIAPGAPADVNIRVQQYPLGALAPITREIEGTANAYGIFTPPEQTLEMSMSGVYIADYSARYIDPRGRLWAGSARGVGVIAQRDSNLIAHGARGVADTDSASPDLTWYRTRSYDGMNIDPARLNFPYFTGDLAWIGESADDGMATILQVQDNDGTYERWVAETVYARAPRRDMLQDGLNRDALALITDETQTALAVINAVRPGLSVRQVIAGTDDGALALLWDSDDVYNSQIGVGTTGDRPGDYTFLFGGTVIQADDPDSDYTYLNTAIYGALSVVIDDVDARGARVYPPYNGAAGAGDGGALISIDEQTFDLFFVPGATPPGALLTLGETISVAGQLAPTLPSRVQGTITSPRGIVTSFDGRANAIGYFYDPAHDIITNETGVWTIDISVIGDSITSVGAPEPPYPTGGVLRPFGTRYHVYVLPENAEALETTIELPDVLIPTGVPYNFAFTIPAAWTDTAAYATLTTPSYILGDDIVPINGRTIPYQFSPARIRGSFPNIENEPRGQGNTIVDPMVLTIVATGIDPSGIAQIQARQYTFFYNRLMQITVTSAE